jgi:hypothetical protein
MRVNTVSKLILSIILVMAQTCFALGQDLRSTLKKAQQNLDSLNKFEATLSVQNFYDSTHSEKNKYVLKINKDQYRFEDQNTLIIMDTNYLVKVDKMKNRVSVAKARRGFSHNLLKLDIDLTNCQIKRSNLSNGDLRFVLLYDSTSILKEVIVDVDTSNYVVTRLISAGSKKRDRTEYVLKSLDTSPRFRTKDFNVHRVFYFDASGNVKLTKDYQTFTLKKFI